MPSLFKSHQDGKTSITGNMSGEQRNIAADKSAIVASSSTSAKQNSSMLPPTTAGQASKGIESRPKNYAIDQSKNDIGDHKEEGEARHSEPKSTKEK